MDDPKIIICDTRQQMGRKHHQVKEAYFESQGYRLIRSKMLVGDYSFPNQATIAVDTKKDLSELYGNLIQDHVRFREECILAKDCGIKLYIVIESPEGFTKIADIKAWKNPQYFRYYKALKKAKTANSKAIKPPASNVTLIKIMHTMTKEYGVTFVLTPANKAGETVLNILKGTYQHE